MRCCERGRQSRVMLWGWWWELLQAVSWSVEDVVDGYRGVCHITMDYQGSRTGSSLRSQWCSKSGKRPGAGVGAAMEYSGRYGN